MLAFLFKELKNGRFDILTVNASFKIAEEMTYRSITITPDDHIGRVVDLLSGGSFRALPVTIEGSIQGIMTNKDVVRMLQWEYTH